jgi:hypothetical protein
MATDPLRPTILVDAPKGFKTTGSQRGAQFWPNEFDRRIAGLGMRVYWSRALLCPCRSNDQTDAPDPICPECKGRGWQWVLPDRRLIEGGEDAQGNPVEISPDGRGVMARAVITSMTADPQVYEKFGQWIFGTCKIATFRTNRLAYMDRLACVDSTIPVSQLVVCDGGAKIKVVGRRSSAGLWAPAADVTHLHAIGKWYERDQDYRLLDSGEIEWISTPPIPGTRLTLSVFIRPRFLITDHALPIRDTQAQGKSPGKPGKDWFQRLPGSAVGKLEFLVDE